jgi:hypothetical protein
VQILIRPFYSLGPSDIYSILVLDIEREGEVGEEVEAREERKCTGRLDDTLAVRLGRVTLAGSEGNTLNHGEKLIEGKVRARG